MSSIFDIHNLAVEFALTTAISYFVSRVTPSIQNSAANAAKSVGGFVVQQVAHDVSPTLRPLVLGELKNLCTNAQSQSQTVLDTATHILNRIAPSIPSATVGQVATILSEFVLTFEGGLASSLDSTT